MYLLKNNRMKIIQFIGIFLLIGICFSCNKNDEPSQEQEAENLHQKLSEIEALANSVDCIDSSEWEFTSYGEKACGGPVGYIAYSKTIDTIIFLQKIEEHRSAQHRYNENWGEMSDCMTPAEPTNVICENGLPVFEY